MTTFDRDKMRLYMRERRKEREALGRCIICGNPEKREGIKHCDKCIARASRNNKKRAEERKYKKTRIIELRILLKFIDNSLLPFAKAWGEDDNVWGPQSIFLDMKEDMNSELERLDKS